MKKRLLLALFFLLVGLQGFLLFSSPENQPSFGDFKIYYDAGGQFTHSESVYKEYPDWPGKIKFKYAPSVALFFGQSISKIPYDHSKWIFYVLSLAMWIGWVLCFSGADWIALGLFSAVFANALRNELGLGQANWIPLLLLTYFFHNLDDASRARKYWLKGALALSVAIQFKLYSLVGVYLLLIRREFRILLTVLILSVVSILVIPSLFQGWDFVNQETLRWIATLTSSSHELLNGYENVSILGVLSKKLGIGPASQGIWLALGGLAFLIPILRPLPARSLGPYLLLMIVLFNPLAWPYWILFGAPAFLLTLSSVRNRFKLMVWQRKAIWISALGLLLLSTNTIDRAATRNGGVIFACVLLLGVYHLEVTRHPRSKDSNPE